MTSRIFTEITANPLGWFLLSIVVILTIAGQGMRINNILNKVKPEQNRTPKVLLFLCIILLILMMGLQLLEILALVPFVGKILGLILFLQGAINVLWTISGTLMSPTHPTHRILLMTDIFMGYLGFMIALLA